MSMGEPRDYYAQLLAASWERLKRLRELNSPWVIIKYEQMNLAIRRTGARKGWVTDADRIKCRKSRDAAIERRQQREDVSR